MTRGAQVVRIPEARNTVPGRTISPELKSWIRSVIVPTLVKEYLAEQSSPISLAPKRQEVIKTGTNTATARMVGR